MPKPYVAPFKKGELLILRPAPNGGWVVSKDEGNPHMRDIMIGAFGSASQMLAALSDALAETD